VENFGLKMLWLGILNYRAPSTVLKSVPNFSQIPIPSTIDKYLRKIAHIEKETLTHSTDFQFFKIDKFW
jgi:hypothetical protein